MHDDIMVQFDKLYDMMTINGFILKLAIIYIK